MLHVLSKKTPPIYYRLTFIPKSHLLCGILIERDKYGLILVAYACSSTYATNANLMDRCLSASCLAVDSV